MKESQRHTARMAEDIAATEEMVAATLEQKAEDRPEHAKRLRAESEAAREFAACERQWAKDLAAD